MGLIIDGYNLLNVTAIVGRGGRGSSLEQSRTALLDFLAQRLGPEERSGTTVVFDARRAPPGLQRTHLHRGMIVRFAPPRREADDVIEELIRSESAPRRLTVVSSDHRLQRAARRRRATAVDSEVWFRQLAKRAAVEPPAPVEPPGASEGDLADEELQQWLRLFAEPLPCGRHPRAEAEPNTAGPAADAAHPRPERPAAPPLKESADFVPPENGENPFPPGYAEDLLD